MSNSYSNLLQPNPKAVLPTNQSVPNILNKFTAPNPVQSALTNMANSTPSWQQTLSQVQNFNNTLPKTNTASPSTGGQSMLPTSGGQSLLPTLPKATTQSLVSTPPPTINPNQNTSTYNTGAGTPAQTNTNLYLPGSSGNGGSAPLGTSSTLAQDQQKAANQNQPGYDMYGNPLNPQSSQSTQSTQTAVPTQNSDTQGYTNAVTGLVNLNATNPGNSGPAFDAYQQAIQRQQQLKSDIAKQYTNVEKQGIPLEFVQGQEGMLNRQYASQLDAAQQAVNEQQAALGYQISGQGTQNSGLGTAGSLTAPRQQGYVTINPQTGQAQGGSNIGSAINQGAGYDAQYQGALAAGTDNQAINGAQNNVQSLASLLQNSPELNRSGVNAVNATYQALQKNLSSSDLSTLNNTIQTISQALSKVTGQSVADTQNLLTSSQQSILTTINNAIQSAKGIAAGKTTSPNNTSSSTSSGGLYNF